MVSHAWKNYSCKNDLSVAGQDTFMKCVCLLPHTWLMYTPMQEDLISGLSLISAIHKQNYFTVSRSKDKHIKRLTSLYIRLAYIFNTIFFINTQWTGVSFLLLEDGSLSDLPLPQPSIWVNAWCPPDIHPHRWIGRWVLWLALSPVSFTWKGNSVMWSSAWVVLNSALTGSPSVAVVTFGPVLETRGDEDKQHFLVWVTYCISSV